MALVLVGGLVSYASAADTNGRGVTLRSAGATVAAEVFEASGQGRRPAVIILHGKHGLAAFRGHYGRIAVALAGAGMDAYLANYYVGDDARSARDPNQRANFFSEHLRGWSRLVRAMTDGILSGDRASGRIGVLGYSQGGFLAVAVAGQDPRIAAVGVFYGGVPGILRSEITRLPPLLELHGDADRLVPLRDGKTLVDLARTLGQPAEMVVYPGAGHGFSGADEVDAERRVVGFFRRHLLPAAE